MEDLGTCLGGFHSRYAVQHGDFQPSNIFFDEETGSVALIDVGGMGVPTTETDMEHFAKSLRLLSDVYGTRLSTEGLGHFERGYAKAAPSSMPHHGLCSAMEPSVIAAVPLAEGGRAAVRAGHGARQSCAHTQGRPSSAMGAAQGSRLKLAGSPECSRKVDLGAQLQVLRVARGARWCPEAGSPRRTAR
eukprot:CAMPEP_0168408276 /NCGR_PEP_ID=MMETSP0228-20121227/26589_1 /TAXON_ID=133427 /ORGANISM="Protoceratium reticulatum, Strain CCCM 535 (=CCMP 1889)" /LENGTH=188 /DNA_ID=CAMNT_0008421961 /DNA_START=54 /DNA_END=617 /DNA_ORIENTATION=-